MIKVKLCQPWRHFSQDTTNILPEGSLKTPLLKIQATLS